MNESRLEYGARGQALELFERRYLYAPQAPPPTEAVLIAWKDLGEEILACAAQLKKPNIGWDLVGVYREKLTRLAVPGDAARSFSIQFEEKALKLLGADVRAETRVGKGVMREFLTPVIFPAGRSSPAPAPAASAGSR
ncbi:MAG: hypothetical protein HY815_23700 [Candidatus Riflebacteria bacterium]|nr:hypothetical protein [Candidatus Riflebacteria bacterium]